MSPESRIWIYQAHRPMSDDEVACCRRQLEPFVTGWTAHNAALKASFDILYNRFIILCVDETQAGASGCSIDKSVREIVALGNELGIDFFNRLQLAYTDDTGAVKSSDREGMQQLLEQGQVRPDTLVFNNTVLTLSAFQNNWKIPYSKSWAFRK